jgi:hypothetical protein
LALSEKFGLCPSQQFCGYFVAGLLGRLALDRLTHCKDECLSVTKAPEPVCSYFCSDFADLSANELERLVFKRYQSARTRLQFLQLFCGHFAQALFGS